MSFIRSSDGQSRLKHSRSLAYDTQLNNRNLEDPWYPMWNFVLTELTEERPSLHVAPQCTLWVGKIRPSSGDVTPDEDAVEPEPEPEPEPEHRAPKQPTPLLQNSTRNTRRSQKAREDSSEVTVEDIKTAGRRQPRSTVVKSAKATPVATPVIAESSTNIISRRRPGPRDSTATTAAPDALERIPDFAIFHTQIERNQTKPFYGGLRVTTLSIPIIVEIKAFVSRRLVGEARDKAIRDVLYATQDQVLEQAGVLFLSFKDVKRVHGIATCGPYWSTAEITPNHVAHGTWKKLKNALDPDHAYEPPVAAVPLIWSSPVEIEDALSSERLQTLRSHLASLQ